MDSAANLMGSEDTEEIVKNNKKYQFTCSEEQTIDNNQTSQELAISSNDEFHWCPDMDYHLSCDNMYRIPNSNANSQISFTLTSGSNSVHCNQQFINNNFDIHLAQIDIETFKSEDIRKIRFNQSLNASNDDTLRIVDSISSFTNHLIPNEDCEALSIDSLDISIDNEINSELIQKCAENDKTKYKIAMIDNSVHSQMHNSQFTTNSVGNPFTAFPDQARCMMNDSQNLQSPGSLVKMFIQNKINSTENPTPNTDFLFDAKNNDSSKFDNSFRLNNNEVNHRSYTTEEAIDESTGNSNSLNTVDSNELPLHVLDLSKKLRSLNLNKQLKYGSTSISSNTTSFTSTTTSSSATTDKRKPNHRPNQYINNTNPFLNICEENKITKSAGTQFPDMFQDKEVQASFEEFQIKAPVLVYYPNYSLPDLSFLQEIFSQDFSDHPVYLSPVKHEPAKMKPEISSVQRRVNSYNNNKRKGRPKSYTDYETLLNQDLSHIKDWDSLNLLLPDDFREFIEQNNIFKFKTNEEKETDQEQIRRNSKIPLPMKKMIPNNHRLFQNVKLRPHSMRNSSSQTKRYSLQEHHLDQNNLNYCNYPNPNRSLFVNNNCEINSSMIRSQTMPNCQMALNHPHTGTCYPHVPPQPQSRYHNCCHTCCHSGCHSPSITSSQSSPQKPNLNWELLSSNSFKKLLSFLSKLDEYSLHSDSSNAETLQDKQSQHNSKCGLTIHTLNNNNCHSVNHSKTSHKHKSLNHKNFSKDFRQMNHHPQSLRSNSNIQTNKNSFSEKTKVILKRPTSLNKNNPNNSGIPVSKRMSSMIPVLKNPNTQSSIQNQQIGRHNKNGNTRF